jgi:hypothetical protein
MLIIRDQQMDAFEAHARRQLEAKILARLRQFYPTRCEALGEPAVVASIKAALERADTYDIAAPDALVLYVELTYHLGRDFDVDAALLWAGEILRDAHFDADAKVEVLYARAQFELGEGFGAGERGADGR